MSGLVYTSLLCRTFVASNAIQTIDNEMLYLIISHYLLFELHLTQRKFDIRATYKLGLKTNVVMNVVMNVVTVSQ